MFSRSALRGRQRLVVFSFEIGISFTNTCLRVCLTLKMLLLNDALLKQAPHEAQSFHYHLPLRWLAIIPGRLHHHIIVGTHQEHRLLHEIAKRYGKRPENMPLQYG